MSDAPRTEMERAKDAPAVAIRSVDRACQVLGAFTLDEPALALGELVRRVGLPKATVHRLAASLMARGMLAQSADGRYRLGVKLLELGAVVRETLNAVQICRPVVARLAERSGETVLLGTVDWPAREMLIVQRLDSPHPLAVGSPVGRRVALMPGSVLSKAALAGLAPGEAEAVVGELPLSASTEATIVEAGALLADLARARERGYAVERGEYFDGVCGVAVPVIFDGAQPLASIGIVGPSTRIAGELDALGELLCEETASMRPVTLPAGAAGGEG